MSRALFVTALVAAVPGVVRGEPFTAWESSGDIWARNQATGHAWNLTETWDSPASNPDVAAYTVVCETTNNVFPAIYAADLDHRFPVDIFPACISGMDLAPVSEPDIGAASTSGWGGYWRL